MGNYNILPSDDTDLETIYSAGDLANVGSKNDERVPQTALEEFMIHQFKDFVGENTRCTLECELQTTQDPALSTVYLQIYNQNTDTWIDVDSDNASPINTDFTLTGSIADLTDYKLVGQISCRVYQEAK